jgi:hypothetical protein
VPIIAQIRLSGFFALKERATAYIEPGWDERRKSVSPPQIFCNGLVVVESGVPFILLQVCMKNDKITRPVSRRSVLGATAAALTASASRLAFAQTRADIEKGEHNHSASNPGPINKALAGENPASLIPPSSDHGNVEPIWYSFEIAHRRIQDGGWTRQVTQRELHSSQDVAGVNMRLTAGSYRELHWHDANEWAYMLYGNARVMRWDSEAELQTIESILDAVQSCPIADLNNIEHLLDTGSLVHELLELREFSILRLSIRAEPRLRGAGCQTIRMLRLPMPHDIRTISGLRFRRASSAEALDRRSESRSQDRAQRGYRGRQALTLSCDLDRSRPRETRQGSGAA